MGPVSTGVRCPAAQRELRQTRDMQRGASRAGTTSRDSRQRWHWVAMYNGEDSKDGGDRRGCGREVRAHQHASRAGFTVSREARAFRSRFHTQPSTYVRDPPSPKCGKAQHITACVAPLNKDARVSTLHGSGATSGSTAVSGTSAPLQTPNQLLFPQLSAQ